MIGSRSGAAEHRGSAHLLIAKHSENLAKTRQSLFELSRNNVESCIAWGDPGPSIEENQLHAWQRHHLVKGRFDLDWFIFDDQIACDAVTKGCKLLAQIQAIVISFRRPAVTDRNQGNGDRAMSSNLTVLISAHNGL